MSLRNVALQATGNFIQQLEKYVLVEVTFFRTLKPGMQGEDEIWAIYITDFKTSPGFAVCEFWLW